MRGWTIALIVSLVVVMIILFAVCNDDESGDTTTTSPVTSTSVPDSTTTTAQPTTTSTSEATTTTVPGTTTTVDDGLLEGNWAPEPLIVAEYGALGWWDGGGWVQVDSGTPLPVAGGEDYQLARLGLEGVTTGGAEDLLCDPLLNPGVVLDDAGFLGEYPDPVGVAISAPWTLTPFLAEEIDDDGTYGPITSGLLAERGLTVASPLIKQVLRTDLEGDGVNEVIVVAEDVPSDLIAEEGDYSLVFMQRVVGGTVETLVFAESVVVELADGETPFVLSFAVGALADLNGDGIMEVVLDSNYYEGSAVEVWEYVGDDFGLLAQISTGCGV